jgi:molecular chaperone DnaK (HSP70)
MFVGLDFGTTTSCISYYNSTDIVVIPNAHGNQTTPSTISFSPDYTFGESAINPLTGMKRLLGLPYEDFLKNTQLTSYFHAKNIAVLKDPESEFCAIQFRDADRVISISYLIKMYISNLIEHANQYLNSVITHAVVTVPAYYNDLQRQMMKSICDCLNVEILRILNEPTAAALAYSLQNNTMNENIMVIDCGGGTTDISVIEMDYEEKVYQVTCVAGDNFLGGEDITHNLVQYMAGYFNIDTKTLKPKQLSDIYEACEQIKKQLSYSDNAKYTCELGEDSYTFTLSMAKFLHINRLFFETISLMIEQVLLTEKIDKVVFVGGSTRIPYFKTIVQKLMGPNIAICDSIDPDHTVSIGAVVQGSMLLNSDDVKSSTVIDVTNMTLGVEIEGGIMNRIISRNTPIPTSKTMVFTNSQDFTDTITINVFQGERLFVKDNVKLATFDLHNLDKTLKSGEMHIHVVFSIDKDGIVSVQAKDSKTNKSNSVCIKKGNTELIEEPDFETIVQDQSNYQLHVAKQSLYKNLMKYIGIFHSTFPQSDKTTFMALRMNYMFNCVLDVIIQYKYYTQNELKEITRSFENAWHIAMLSYQVTMFEYGATILF